MSNLSVFSKAGLPAISTLSSALKSISASAGPVGVVILKMDKGGHWVFGADQTEVEDDSTWAVNPFSFVIPFKTISLSVPISFALFALTIRLSI